MYMYYIFLLYCIMWYKLYIHYVRYIYVKTQYKIRMKNLRSRFWALMAAVPLKWQGVDIGWLLLL